MGDTSRTDFFTPLSVLVSVVILATMVGNMLVR